ncbi:MAG: endonuclease MutS2 [Eubacteriales bacterium]|nr:endonuclease MutS2 [Eubacteriales bacterium]
MDICDKSIRNLEYLKVLERLTHKASSALGREKCLALRPAASYEASQAAQQETADLLEEIIRKGDLPLAGFDDVREIIAYLGLQRMPAPADLLRVGRQLRLVAQLQRRLPDDSSEEGESSLCYQLIDSLEALSELEGEIERCILNDDELQDRASSELYRLRRKIESLQEQVQSSLQRIVRSQAEYLQDQLITLRGGRYVIPVKAEHRNKIPGLVHDSSSTGATVFIEPMQVVELNNQVREAKNEEEREVRRILSALGAYCYDFHEQLLANQETLVRLDFAQAKARLALEQKAHRPNLNQDGKILLKSARHPLIDPEKVVPIDFELGYSFTSLIITGPNTGGKTVSLKTCGLLTLMAMSGLHVPASEGSELAFFPYVLADIGDEQSIEQSLSTFSSHMKHIIQICDLAGPGTLVIADELGAGTDPTEGAALAIAILDHLKQKGAHVVASTHYQELKGYALNTPGVSNASCEFDSESMRPTYKLLIGVPGVSNAINISTRLGLQREIIDKAKALISDEGAQFQSLLEAIEQSERKSRQMEEEISRLHEKAEKTRAENEKEKQRLRAEANKVMQQARQEAYVILARAELQAEEQLKALRQSAQATKELEDGKLKLRQEKEKLGKSLAEESVRSDIKRELTAEDLVLGEEYQDVLSGFVGQLVEMPDSKNQVGLSKGNLTLRVALNNLQPAKAGNQSDQANKKVEFSKAPLKLRKRGNTKPISTRATTKAELYLLGYRVNDAVAAVDSYLDDAVLAGLSSVRIVHGKGTGALRQAVRDKLAHDPRVATYGDAAFGAGDAGVTVVELRV